jgi:hypothetical protein
MDRAAAQHARLAQPFFFLGGLLVSVLAVCFPMVSPCLLGVGLWVALLLRAGSALRRARATVEQIYRREDAVCRPWGNA